MGLGAKLGGLGMTAELVEEAGVVLPDPHPERMIRWLRELRGNATGLFA
jgi:hypothetical protein